jgi:predicted enzyme related to lactoylglutathione lyase
MIGLNIDESIETAAAKLKSCRARNVGAVERGAGGNFVHFEDPDGNQLYLWEMAGG